MFRVIQAVSVAVNHDFVIELTVVNCVVRLEPLVTVINSTLLLLDSVHVLLGILRFACEFAVLDNLFDVAFRFV